MNRMVSFTDRFDAPLTALDRIDLLMAYVREPSALPLPERVRVELLKLLEEIYEERTATLAGRPPDEDRTVQFGMMHFLCTEAACGQEQAAKIVLQLTGDDDKDHVALARQYRRRISKGESIAQVQLPPGLKERLLQAMQVSRT